MLGLKTSQVHLHKLNKVHLLQLQLENHSLYSKIETKKQLCTFMSFHVFAVWDFMTLLKFLQQKLTCVSIPWFPSKNNKYTRFINEIVLNEESDYDLDGNNKSHFEMYHDSMKDLGASTLGIDAFLASLMKTKDFGESLRFSELSSTLVEFLSYNMKLIESKETHKVLSLFTFSRELLLPKVFLGLLEGSQKMFEKTTKFKFYLERHIQLDGDEHGPMALDLLNDICGDDLKMWDEVYDVAICSLRLRIKLWDQVETMIGVKVQS